ncbi:MAG: DNA repair protein RecN [Candidatus Thiodiazotropha taylori]|nr:DNA repair protein RecN [Candidatus Thiodiazotropha taylori]
MLVQLQIHNLAVVSGMALELLGGLTALTGETGAGKSILIDALGLALGEKADNGLIRSGADRAEVTAQFDITNTPEAGQWLRQQDLDEGDECILRRSLNREGRSRCYINGRSVPMQQLQDLGDLLVEIHGQHAHQSLLKANHQRRLLDAYAGHTELSHQLAQHYKSYQKDLKRLQLLTAETEERASRMDLLRYQAEELAALDVSAEELISIEKEHSRLSHLEQIRTSCNQILSGLDGEQHSLRSQLSRSLELVSEIEQLDGSLKDPREMIDSALIQVDEALAFLRNYLNDIALDPSGLQQLEERLGLLHDASRKYRVKPNQLPEKLQQIQAEIGTLEGADETLSELASQVEAGHAAYLKLGEQLSKKRRTAAKRLSRVITDAMQTLGMPGGQFNVLLTPLETDQAGANGLEQVDFQVSANPGLPLDLLSKVASGGELSRISLAIQVATIECGTTPTLIFDEVDVGIGGGVAEIVGQMLRKLSSNRQILCVTHLPQVAAQAMHHFQVQKTTQQKSTSTDIARLDDDQRIQEIARMLGGIKITEQTLAHAQEMVTLAAEA